MSLLSYKVIRFMFCVRNPEQPPEDTSAQSLIAVTLLLSCVCTMQFSVADYYSVNFYQYFVSSSDKQHSCTASRTLISIKIIYLYKNISFHVALKHCFSVVVI